MKSLKESVCITLDADLLAELREEAEKEGRSLSSLINIILKNHMQSNNED